MKAVSFSGINFAANNVTGRIVRGLPGPEANPLTLPRPGTHPIPLGMAVGTRPLAVRFDALNPASDADAEAKLLTLLGLLDPTNQDERVLVVELDTDGDGTAETTAEVFAALGQWTWMPGAKAITATFHATDPIWRAQNDTADTGNAISVSGDNFVVTNGGHARAHPLVKVGWTTQRTTESPTVGWKHRKTVTITNDETRTEARDVKFLDLGDAAAIVSAGKALASGNDLRVRLSGQELPRTLINWNTKRTFCAVAVTIPAGESRTLEIVYGNPDATAPFTLAEQGQARAHPERFSALDQMHVHGTSTGGTSVNALEDTNNEIYNPFPINRFRGGNIQVLTGAAAGERRRISSNDANAFTVTRPFTVDPGAAAEYVVWMSGLYVNGGIASSGASTTLTDSSQTFGGNELIGGTITIDSGTGSGQSRTIKSNTATVITVTAAWDTNPDSTSVYSIERPGFHIYYVEQETKRSSTVRDTLPAGDVWTGGWFQDARFSRPGVVMTAADGIANAWDRWLLRRNNDDISNSSTYQFDMGGGDLDSFNGLDADRRVGSDRTLKEEGTADGVAITNPHGYDALFFDYQQKNPNGVATFVVLSRAAGGSEWQTHVEDATARATLTAVAAQWLDLSGAEQGSPVHLYMGQLPKDPDEEEDIPATASPNDVATVRWYRRLELFLNLDNWSVGTLSAEESIYDLNARLKFAALGADPPYGQIEFGGDGHHVHVPSGQKVWVRVDPDTTEPIIGLYNGDVLVAEIPYAGVIYRYIKDIRGNAVATVDRSGGELPPGNTTVTVIEEEIGTLSIDVVFKAGYIA